MWLTLLFACSETGLGNEAPLVDLPGEFDTEDPADPSDPTDPSDPLEPELSTEFDTPPTDHDPELHLDADCDGSFIAEFSDGEIWVGNNANAPEEAQGVLHASDSGWYDLYNTHIVESGASQHNESAYFRVVNDTNPIGAPVNGNCGALQIVADADNDGPPPGNQTFLGTFWFDAGENILVMRHYCDVESVCPDFEVSNPSDQTCESGNVNSVHFMGFAVCLMPV